MTSLLVSLAAPSLFGSTNTPVDRYQREFSLLNRFGLQANVIIAASYANSESQDLVLSKALIYPALRQVVRQYPELGLINYCRSSERKRSQHRLYSAVLQNINLDAHVQFINIPREEEDAGLGTTIERYHGLWFDPSKTPPWRLVVVNGRHALLVFDHFITDARGGSTSWRAYWRHSTPQKKTKAVPQLWT
ncbi:hypothetical protein N7462_009553 [Penicillium macrosclerotiorum]|uniref:uncharacterized protein n=1 Tax=Penicillium macrosclerotiorum TaxID=303699 RepID=UPI0025473BE0|nr:uncharacterized protein N7462_009553 [Penicillium macrosclerotiorum]KAJ5674114.1 hypothetical protein N7462_009553 [Penicillium macrosclerotiorum]